MGDASLVDWAGEALSSWGSIYFGASPFPVPSDPKRLQLFNRFGIPRDKLFFGPMVFTKHLREGVRRGFITCSTRIWKHPRVKVGGHYRMDEGEIRIDSIELISLQDVTDDLAIESGFQSRADLLKVAKHGSGNKVYLVRFRYLLPDEMHTRRTSVAGARSSGSRLLS